MADFLVSCLFQEKILKDKFSRNLAFLVNKDLFYVVLKGSLNIKNCLPVFKIGQGIFGISNK